MNITFYKKSYTIMFFIHETLLIWILSTFCTSNHFVSCYLSDVVTREHSSKCGNNIKFESAGQIKQIGKWKSGCPDNQYLRAVWAENPGELFLYGKCCGKNEVMTEFSWEIRDLPVIRGGKASTDERWNIQCPLYSALTGLRLIEDSRTNERILSSVRCSLLKYQVFDATRCTIMNFKDAQRHIKVPFLNESWQHECPKDYGLVGLFVDEKPTTLVKKIQKGKCCRIYDPKMYAGWESNFTHNFAAFAQYNKEMSLDGLLDGATFETFDYNKTDKSIYLDGTLFPDDPPEIYKGILISPHFDAQKICLKLKLSSRDSDSRVEVRVKQSKLMRSVRRLTVKRGEQNEYQVYISSLDMFQIVISVNVDNSTLKIHKLALEQKDKCTYDSCHNDKDCNENEQCQKYDGRYFRCKCKRGYIEDTTGKCLHPGDKHAKGHTVSPRSQPPVTTTPSSHKIPEPGPHLALVSIAGSAVGVIIVIIGLTVCLCYRNSINEKAKRMNSFEQEMNIVDRTNQLLAVTSSGGKEGGPGARSLYRPYMENLGFVEHLSSVVAATITDSASSAESDSIFPTPPRYCVDVTTGEPLYTTINKYNADSSPKGIINHGLQHDENNNTIIRKKYTTMKSGITKKAKHMNTYESTKTTTTPTNVGPKQIYHLNHDDNNNNDKTNQRYFFSLIEKSKETDKSLGVEDQKSRRASADTLSIPDYGDESSDSDDPDDTNGSLFFIPGDDEEDLIGDLNEIHNDSIKISTRVIGQGAFGVVKHGTLHSVKGTKDVAIKMLKERSGTEISKEDRVKFYQEAVIVSQFDHHNVVALFGIMVSKTPCMVLEYMPRGNLSKYLGKVCRIRKREGITDISREMQCVFLKMARDIVDGMCYLASLKFVHRDLAARNILLDEYDGDLICKISDFGLSRHFIKDNEYYTSRGGNIPIRWTAPEAIMSRKYSTQSDVWSYAIVLWEIWSFGTQPYENWSNEKVIREVCEKGYRLPPPEAIPSVLHRLMVDCWSDNKSYRPTFSKLRFCLNYPVDRLLGKEDSDNNNNNNRNQGKRTDRIESYSVSSENGDLPIYENEGSPTSAQHTM